MKIGYRSGSGFVLALLIPLIILGGVAFKPLLAETQGEEILLATDAYDPRDLFRGDYVHLNLEINRSSYDRLSEVILDDVEKYNNSFIYVLLKPGESGYHSIDTILEKPPSDGVYLKARIYGLSNRQYDKGALIVYLDYGLERYYVQENTGEELQYDSNDGILDVKARVYKGYGYVEGLMKRDSK
jgi:uncharacterized membrane-anchored protein